MSAPKTKTRSERAANFPQARVLPAIADGRIGFLPSNLSKPQYFVGQTIYFADENSCYCADHRAKKQVCIHMEYVRMMRSK